jgi:hypothetical protein
MMGELKALRQEVAQLREERRQQQQPGLGLGLWAPQGL